MEDVLNHANVQLYYRALLTKYSSLQRFQVHSSDATFLSISEGSRHRSQQACAACSRTMQLRADRLWAA